MKAKGIFISAITAMAVLTGCNEDENIVNRTNGNELCISATIPTLTRAPIEGTQLPDHSQIGVSLLNPDGSDYDGNAHCKNVLYKSETTGNGTSWSSANPIILSPTIGKAVAYYPYSASISDISAISVETASQTDYLYSDWVNGLSFDKPQANFTMNHALCAVQVNLTNESYTAGPGQVTQLSVASPALATTASLNAQTGQLSAFAGQGDAITVDKTFTLTGEPQGTKVIAIPTGTQGNLSIKVVVDEAASTVPVSLNKPLVQGKVYVVNLKVKDAKTPVELVSVTVKDWVQEVVGDFNASPTQKDNYIIKVNIPSNSTTFKSNVKGFTGTINWGDGTEITSHSDENNPSHTYANAGTYTITHKGTCPQLGSDFQSGLENHITDIIYIGSELNITSMTYAFFGSKITTLKEGVFNNLSRVTDFTGAFQSCSFLTSLPVGLFDKCTQATDFSNTFNGCKALVNIPGGLFFKNTEAKSFSGTFQGCSAIKGIFPKLFSQCGKVTDFSDTFSGCTSLTTIPNELFHDCHKVTDFSRTFASCASLINIPTDLFSRCSIVTRFIATFSGCSALKNIPASLFYGCQNVDNFHNAFFQCKSLTTIPAGLFDQCKRVSDFSGTFYGCTNARGESPYTLINGQKIHLYERNNYPSQFTRVQVMTRCFSECKFLTDFSKIGQEWK